MGLKEIIVISKPIINYLFFLKNSNILKNSLSAKIYKANFCYLNWFCYFSDLITNLMTNPIFFHISFIFK